MLSCHKDSCKSKPCCEKKHFNDCVQCDWQIIGGQLESSQTIYTTSGVCPVVTGKIKFCHASSPGETSQDAVPNRVRVDFYRGTTVIQSHDVFLGSCLAFTLGGFDRIVVDRRLGFQESTVTGEICIETNYSMS